MIAPLLAVFEKWGFSQLTIGGFFSHDLAVTSFPQSAASRRWISRKYRASRMSLGIMRKTGIGANRGAEPVARPCGRRLAAFQSAQAFQAHSSPTVPKVLTGLYASWPRQALGFSPGSRSCPGRDSFAPLARVNHTPQRRDESRSAHAEFCPMV